jgi:CHAT domain-containing protein
LHFIPWAILDTEFPISTLPTGAWLNRNRDPQQIGQKIAVVGDPDFGGKLPQLAGARDEAFAVGKFYGVKPLVGKEATENNVRKEVGEGVKVLHIATHGIYDSIRPLQSALFLSESGSAYPLTAKQLYENPLPATLVILSACETGLGKTVAGDDLLGLTRSFYLGGTQSVLSSLWEIEDEGTREYMLKFHQSAAKGDFGEAWLEARDHVKAKGFPASVYGAFNLNGVLP